ncbi:aspartate/tyrosine/aromatic aminotransferase, partial [Rothia kristinae]
MDAIDVLQDLAARPLQAAEGFAERLTAEKLNAHPGGQDNSIAWLLWHAARVGVE